MLKAALCLTLTVSCAFGDHSSDISWDVPPEETKDGPNAEKGFVTLGKHCFGYTPLSTKKAGQVDLRLDLQDPDEADEAHLEVLLFTDESWKEYIDLPSNAACTDRRSKAENWRQHSEDFHNFKPGVTTNWVATSFGVKQWVMKPFTITEQFNPKMWYVALINCDSNDQLVPIPEIKYDIRFTGLAGVYDDKTGPSQCTVGEQWHEGLQTGFVAGIVIFALIDAFLGFIVFRNWWRNRPKQGRRKKQGHHAVAGTEMAVTDNDTTLQLDDDETRGSQTNITLGNKNSSQTR
mmetsp:Transcript_3779/g.5716  ORF Transcript_3779/g.5716 Transcript_3779/m.5716 type:complete len:291 (-) Transcript_3779:298-1170(-)|eukprot:CAMPEP_0175091456 /NCGR_PEP_ID=MMETSP0086_2-20121207/1910_1 /TAXON_ID=136419 /ORGANISM="Unknown Unknown, Strain D1" /LENGTH=290 /DNA_ID=CAMNT_0016364195 /DNA_START=43 /DNA_END=915 /DNA_ORIENTATION=+